MPEAAAVPDESDQEMVTLAPAAAVPCTSIPAIISAGLKRLSCDTASMVMSEDFWLVMSEIAATMLTMAAPSNKVSKTCPVA